VTFPIDTVYFDGTNPITCKIGTTTTSCSSLAFSTDPTEVSTDTLSNVCKTNPECPTGTTITFTVTGYVNPFSTQPNANIGFKVETLRSPSAGGLIDSVSFDGTQLSLSPNVITATLSQPVIPVIVEDT
jgi:hypothetical protein